MKIIYPLIVILMFLSGALSAETPNELAVKIIKGHFKAADNVSGGSPEELAKAQAFHSKVKLSWLIISDQSVSEELRISYAIHLLDNALVSKKSLRTGESSLTSERLLIKQRLILSSRLAEILMAELERAVKPVNTDE